MKIEDLENQIERGLERLGSTEVIPKGFRPRVILKSASGLEKKCSDPVNSWSPQDGDYIEISFERRSGNEIEASSSHSLAENEFAPVVISGEPLSATILRDRR